MAADEGNETGSPVEPAPIAAPAEGGRAEKRRAKADKRSGRRGRSLARVASLALIVCIGVIGWQWTKESGLLEPGGERPTAVTVQSDRPDTPAQAQVDESEWSDLLDDATTEGSVATLQDGEGSVRIDGEAVLTLAGSALAELGERARFALLVRAQGAGASLSVTCDLGGEACGRKRFPVAREASELLFDAPIGSTGELRLVLRPDLTGEAVPVELLAVRARSL